jgi:hypothetical protein
MEDRLTSSNRVGRQTLQAKPMCSDDQVKTALVCRHIKDREKRLKRCRDIVHDGRGFILVLEDVDIKALLEFRARKDYKGVHNYLDELFRKLVM